MTSFIVRAFHLFAGPERVKALKEKYPELVFVIDLLAENDPTEGQHKYLDWAVRQLVRTQKEKKDKYDTIALQDHLLSQATLCYNLLHKFHKNLKYFGTDKYAPELKDVSKSINNYKSISDLQQMLMRTLDTIRGLERVQDVKTNYGEEYPYAVREFIRPDPTDSHRSLIFILHTYLALRNQIPDQEEEDKKLVARLVRFRDSYFELEQKVKELRNPGGLFVHRLPEPITIAQLAEKEQDILAQLQLLASDAAKEPPILYQDETVKAYGPLRGREQLCLHGTSEWCVSRWGASYYDGYMAKGGDPYFIIIEKRNEDDEDKVSRYLAFVHHGFIAEFRDEFNSSAPTSEFSSVWEALDIEESSTIDVYVAASSRDFTRYSTILYPSTNKDTTIDQAQKDRDLVNSGYKILFVTMRRDSFYSQDPVHYYDVTVRNTILEVEGAGSVRFFVGPYVRNAPDQTTVAEMFRTEELARNWIYVNEIPLAAIGYVLWDGKVSDSELQNEEPANFNIKDAHVIASEPPNPDVAGEERVIYIASVDGQPIEWDDVSVENLKKAYALRYGDYTILSIPTTLNMVTKLQYASDAQTKAILDYLRASHNVTLEDKVPPVLVDMYTLEYENTRTGNFERMYALRAGDMNSAVASFQDAVRNMSKNPESFAFTTVLLKKVTIEKRLAERSNFDDHPERLYAWGEDVTLLLRYPETKDQPTLPTSSTMTPEVPTVSTSTRPQPATPETSESSVVVGPSTETPVAPSSIVARVAHVARQLARPIIVRAFSRLAGPERVKILKEKYPEFAKYIDYMAARDPSKGQQKYLDWAVRYLIQDVKRMRALGYDEEILPKTIREHIKEVYITLLKDFHKSSKYFGTDKYAPELKNVSRDINTYKGREDLERMLGATHSIRSGLRRVEKLTNEYKDTIPYAIREFTRADPLDTYRTLGKLIITYQRLLHNTQTPEIAGEPPKEDKELVKRLVHLHNSYRAIMEKKEELENQLKIKGFYKPTQAKKVKKLLRIFEEQLPNTISNIKDLEGAENEVASRLQLIPQILGGEKPPVVYQDDKIVAYGPIRNKEQMCIQGEDAWCVSHWGAFHFALYMAKTGDPYFVIIEKRVAKDEKDPLPEKGKSTTPRYLGYIRYDYLAEFRDKSNRLVSSDEFSNVWKTLNVHTDSHIDVYGASAIPEHLNAPLQHVSEDKDTTINKAKNDEDLNNSGYEVVHVTMPRLSFYEEPKIVPTGPGITIKEIVMRKKPTPSPKSQIVPRTTQPDTPQVPESFVDVRPQTPVVPETEEALGAPKEPKATERPEEPPIVSRVATLIPRLATSIIVRAFSRLAGPERVKILKEKYPHLAEGIDVLAELDPSEGQQKYLDWGVKHLATYVSPILAKEEPNLAVSTARDEIAPSIAQFHKIVKYLGTAKYSPELKDISKDINQYKSLLDLDNVNELALTALEGYFKVEEAYDSYPKSFKYAIREFARNDPSGRQEYLRWALDRFNIKVEAWAHAQKEYTQEQIKEDILDIVDVYGRYHHLRENKEEIQSVTDEDVISLDEFKHFDYQEALDYVSELEPLLDVEAPAALYSTKQYEVFGPITSKAQLCSYSSGKWCVATWGRQEFEGDNYMGDPAGNPHFVLIKSRKDEDNQWLAFVRDSMLVELKDRYNKDVDFDKFDDIWENISVTSKEPTIEIYYAILDGDDRPLYVSTSLQGVKAAASDDVTLSSFGYQIYWARMLLEDYENDRWSADDTYDDTLIETVEPEYEDVWFVGPDGLVDADDIGFMWEHFETEEDAEKWVDEQLEEEDPPLAYTGWSIWSAKVTKFDQENSSDYIDWSLQRLEEISSEEPTAENGNELTTMFVAATKMESKNGDLPKPILMTRSLDDFKDTNNPFLRYNGYSVYSIQIPLQLWYDLELARAQRGMSEYTRRMQSTIREHKETLQHISDVSAELYEVYFVLVSGSLHGAHFPSEQREAAYARFEALVSNRPDLTIQLVVGKALSSAIYRYSPENTFKAATDLKVMRQHKGIDPLAVAEEKSQEELPLPPGMSTREHRFTMQQISTLPVGARILVDGVKYQKVKTPIPGYDWRQVEPTITDDKVISNGMVFNSKMVEIVDVPSSSSQAPSTKSMSQLDLPFESSKPQSSPNENDVHPSTVAPMTPTTQPSVRVGALRRLTSPASLSLIVSRSRVKSAS